MAYRTNNECVGGINIAFSDVYNKHFEIFLTYYFVDELIF
jgi:hypothetical protein